MLRRLRRAPLAQVAAALVAVALSGVPRVAGALAPPERHQCRCGDHAPGEQCTCLVCRRAAAEAMAADESLPPCHRAMARAELAAPASAPVGAPCLTGTCGALDPRPVTAAGVEPFEPPPPDVALHPARSPGLATPAPRGPTRAREPETPPPRRGERPVVTSRGGRRSHPARAAPRRSSSRPVTSSPRSPGRFGARSRRPRSIGAAMDGPPFRRPR